MQSHPHGRHITIGRAHEGCTLEGQASLLRGNSAYQHALEQGGSSAARHRPCSRTIQPDLAAGHGLVDALVADQQGPYNLL